MIARVFSALALVCAALLAVQCEIEDRREAEPVYISDRWKLPGDRKVKWGGGPPGTPATVRYHFADKALTAKSLPPAMFTCNGNEVLSIADGLKNSKVSADAFKREVERSMAAWSAVSGIAFERVDSPKEAQLVIGFGNRDDFFSIENPLAATLVSMDDEDFAHGRFSAAALCFHEYYRWGPGGKPIYKVSAHEIGHAIGFDHVPYGRSIMRERLPDISDDLTAADIRGAQYLYGPPQK